MTALLDLEDLACERDGRRLFDGISLTLGAGDYCELTGPNGSGKSTLLRCVAGLFDQFEGRVSAAPLLFQGHRPATSDRLTPHENLRWLLGFEADDHDDDGGGEPQPGADAIEAALVRVGLGAYVMEPCAQLSAGQRRRVSLARLSLTGRKLWLLDEPLTALDVAGVGLVGELISAHRAAGGAVVCATHQSLELTAARALELDGAR